MIVSLEVNPLKDKNYECAVKCAEFLCQKKCKVKVEKQYSSEFPFVSGVVFTDDLYSDTDFAVVFGGDGTIMRAAKKAALNNIPIIGINMGRVGYLAELEPSEYELLEEILKNNYSEEDRMMLDVTVFSNGKKTGKPIHVLNDAVFSKSESSAMPEIKMISNGQETGSYFNDGIVIATPTGSTAYSLSAGGPIVDPLADCICVSHICPQSFYAKPMIFAGSAELEVMKGKRGHGKLFLITDGQDVCELNENDFVKIKKSKTKVKFIRIKTSNFYNRLYSKMAEFR